MKFMAVPSLGEKHTSKIHTSGATLWKQNEQMTPGHRHSQLIKGRENNNCKNLHQLIKIPI